jgi:transposase
VTQQSHQPLSHLPYTDHLTRSHNRVIADRYRHLTTRADNPLSDGQARAALAAGLLRWLHAIVAEDVSWSAAIAAGLIEPPKAKAVA